ncbi:MAG TPA: carboxypeptidase regulatory-like domain-containing protein, partial [Chloroflexota bacterium]|nr:carboxypeptidase regulatory-like domain-containing protein [Chloroflexota bacterium]
TDSSGVVSFTLKPGAYSLGVRLRDAMDTISGVTIKPNTVTRETAGLGSGTLQVRVETTPGHPAVGAEVQVYRGRTSVAANFTNQSGMISFTINAGTYTLQTALGNATGPVTTVQVNSGAVARATIVLNTGTLQVQVDMAPGHPAYAAEVQIYRGSTSVASNFTDHSGMIAFTLNAGAYTARTALGEATGSVATIQVHSGAVAKATSILHAGTLVVKVLTKSGQPMNGATVAVYEGTTYVTTAYTDSTGEASFILKSGSYNVLVSQGATKNKPLSLKVAEGGTGEYTVRLGT